MIDQIPVGWGAVMIHERRERLGFPPNMPASVKDATVKPFRLDFDPDYGIDHRRGWSVHYDGTCLVQFGRGPLRALWAAWRAWRGVLRSRKADAR